MTLEQSLLDNHDLQKQAEQYLIAENYNAAITFYEQAIEREPYIKFYYWNLGLMLLLQGQETEAQMTWLMALSEEGEEELWTVELVKVLENEAERRISIEDPHTALAIRQHIREIIPYDINNLLHIVDIFIKRQDFNEDTQHSLESIINLLPEKSINVYNKVLFLNVVTNLLSYAVKEPYVLTFIEAALKYFSDKITIIDTVMVASIKIGFFQKMPELASQVAELCWQQVPKDDLLEQREILILLANFYQNAGKYTQGIVTAKKCYQIVNTVAEKLCVNALVLRGLMTAGSYWQEVCSGLDQQILLAKQVIQEQPNNLDMAISLRLFSSLFFLPYVNDDPENNRKLQNEISAVCQNNIIKNNIQIVERQKQLLQFRQHNINKAEKTLNIGYISHCLKRHSVGWLSRWIFKYHDPAKFKIHSYFLHDVDCIEQFTKDYFIDRSDKFHTVGIRDHKIWDQIQADKIDILVDLDSLTLDHACHVMSIKAAPIQVTWLGWDASGLPSIDYFIADPYVLPDSAQDYYSETIWRLPQTYIAVDGFEVDVPNLRREHLDIPSDAIVYFMTQKGYKRHEEHLHLQMRIIKEVPNSYLLIKGDADPESSKVFFERIAEEEGVDFSQIRFLPHAPSEAIHRANLGLADVVLDTYPYNGATTTLETLWMGIPIVTRVGQQFAARNSYTMMVNAGITEGIAWTADEYIEWGVRLGKDEKLRQQISWKLRQSRHTAPIWNAKQFTRDMENAYQQMWEIYIDSKK